jgi:hypothetical protein
MVPTLVTELSNLIMLIGTGRLVEIAQRAASQACGARVVQADLKTASTIAAEYRPFAMVVAKDIYEFGGPEFDALARDVRAELIVVPHSIQAAVLAALIVEAASKLS